MNKYTYKGAIMSNGRLIANNWSAETIAISEKKAMSNLAYQAKKACNLIPGSKVELPGKILIVG